MTDIETEELGDISSIIAYHGRDSCRRTKYYDDDDDDDDEFYTNLVTAINECHSLWDHL